ncbi:HDOD domain-containing protein [Fontimonas sp. SYSU GA230001]|uniref:HDOD domain-containing protein n=1 Tax=Fontimonas sp. SYSU GA230001 TaxID=3142450 RepID=UPI0032B527DA
MAEVGVSEQLLSNLWDELSGNKLLLPSLPDIALRIDALMRRDDVDSRQLANELRKDPALTAQVVRMANNAAYRGTQAVTDLRSAITRIGLAATRNLVRALALKQLFASQSSVLQARLRGVWARSLEVAAVAQLLSVRLRRLEPEVALLAGLIHQIGVLPLLRLLENEPELLRSTQAIDHVLDRLGRQAGKMVLASWGFAPALVEIPEKYGFFERSHAGAADYLDLVNVAILALDVHYEGVNASVDRSRVPACAALGLDPALDLLGQPDFAADYDALLAALTS